MNATQAKAIQSEKIARASLRAQSDKLIVDTWMATNGQAPTREVTILRGWLMDELESRMNALDKAQRNQCTPRFDRWMLADCKGVANPGSYLV